MWAYYGAILSLDIYHNTPPHSPTPLPPQKKNPHFFKFGKKNQIWLIWLSFKNYLSSNLWYFARLPPPKKKPFLRFRNVQMM